MRIVTGIGQTGGYQNAYQAGLAGQERQAASGQEQQAAGAQERLKDTLAGQSAGAEASAGSAGGKVKASLPDDQVGQLATELANARSRFDVQQVAGKAMRALASLRMAAALCEGKDKARANRMIARMEKLMKRTRVKIRHLDKEDQLERQRRRAEKEQEQKKAESLRGELASRRKKRRREEANYAMKETAKDRAAAQGGGFFENAAAQAAAPLPPVDGFAPAQAAVETAPAESAALDISV
ncbi:MULTISPECIES: hypothetical protein [Anaerotruncus]|jgi:hypothetical protein|uniref:Uncharacterized protein n=1 Tax=Anaerotruncus colihominis TaxID=169435 RepID=A0A845RJZ4_9FIRM|nr:MULTISPECIES: hypothetical protein [Anaerotruncus]MCI8491570.1 hypothetical protein [Anaerotruncus sp.]MCR2025305.1 hypothetical protein [Anaerotruncus colihominis]NBI79883.1 hypothetical protein [Anaerotruncus colihominis]NDO40401.1 hypothetical protein [Anaerotruncus colihominis]